IVADDFAVLAGAGLGFVGVDDEEAGAAVLALLRHEGPLHAGGEACAATTAQAGGLYLVDNRVLPAGDQRPGVVPIAAHLRCLQPPFLETVEIGEDAVLVSEHLRASS